MTPNHQNFLSFPSIFLAVQQGLVYKKVAKTDLRLPFSDEVGTTLDTFVFDVESKQLRIEISTIISQDSVIARNPGSIAITDAGQVFNEWVVPQEDIEAKYDEGTIGLLTTTFSSHKKKQTIKAIQLTRSLLDSIGISGDTLSFQVSWADTFMTAKIGDFLTDGGYSISQYDMSKTYEPVDS